RPGVLFTLGLLGLIMLGLGISTMNQGDYARYYRCAEHAFLRGQNPYLCYDYFQAPPTLHLMAPFAALGPPLDALTWSLLVGGVAFGALFAFGAVFMLVESR